MSPDNYLNIGKKKISAILGVRNYEKE